MKLWFCVLLKSACFSITWGVTTAKRAHKPTGLIKTVTLRYRRCVVSCFQRRALRRPLLTARKLDSGYVTWICSVQTPETRWKLNTVEFKPRQILSAWVIPSETSLSCFIIQEIVFKRAAIVVQLETTTAHRDASLRNICIRNMWTSAEELNVQQSDTQETLQVRRVRLPVSREDLILDVWDGACLIWNTCNSPRRHITSDYFWRFFTEDASLVVLVRLQINSYLFLVSFSRSVTQLNTQLSCFSFCSFSSLSMFVGLFPVEALCLLLLCPLLLLSSRLSLASLARPSFSRPTRTNLMGDKSEWLTMIKKHGGKSAMEPRGNGNLVFNGSSNPKNLQANRWVLHFTSKSRSRQMYRSEFLKKTTLTVAARRQTLSSPSDCDHTGQTEAVVSPLL